MNKLNDDLLKAPLLPKNMKILFWELTLLKSSKKLQIILLVIILLISLFSGGVIIKLNHGALKDSVKVGESNRFNNQINSEKLKSAIKVG